MFPATPVGLGDGPPGLSYSGIYLAADRDRALQLLGELRFSGWVGPQEGDWVVAVAANPLARVAGGRRRTTDLARDVAAALETRTLAVDVDQDERLWLAAYDDDAEVARYDSDPSEDDEPGEIVLDELGEPIMAGGAFVDSESVAAGLLGMTGAADDDDALPELLDEELGESTSESERLMSVLRILGLPTWIVSSDSLPRDVPGGPRRGTVTKLGAGRKGVGGWFADRVRRPVRPRVKRDDR
jgi:hypothetical protein